MKKAKIDTESRVSYDSFLETENSAEDQNLDLLNSPEIVGSEEVTSKSFHNIIKQIFLFLPGTFLLYLISFIGTIILIDSFFIQEPLVIFGIQSVSFQILLFGIIILFGTLMTWFGLGDIKNKKHLAIPTSILATGGILALISKILGDVFGFTGLFEAMNYYFIYLFPLVLIVPVLVKGWIDKKIDE